MSLCTKTPTSLWTGTRPPTSVRRGLFYNLPVDVQCDYVKALNQDRKNEQTFCDFTIIAETAKSDSSQMSMTSSTPKRFRVHKCVIGVASDFFKMSITTEMKEKYQNSVTLYSVDSDVMEEVLDYIYGVQITIDDDNCRQLLEASEFLQISQLTCSCRQYLNSMEVGEGNVVPFWLFAMHYNQTALLQNCEKYIRKNFVDLSNCEETLNLPFDLMKSYLSLRNEIIDEESFCEVVVKWVEFDSSEREKHFPHLFKLVDLDKLGESFC